MKKCYCDYCGKECKATEDLVLPIKEEIRECATDGHGAKIMQFTTVKVVHKQQDICVDCQEKITYLLKLLPNFKIDKDNPHCYELIFNSN